MKPQAQTTHTPIVRPLAEAARAASSVLAAAKAAQKDTALVQAAMRLRENVAEILVANEADMKDAADAPAATRDRLKLDAARVEAMAAGLETIATLPDPVNITLDEWDRPSGLVIQKVSIPLGVLGVIYESRPNVTADAAGLAIKSGNAVILRGGSESLRSSKAIIACIHQGLVEAELPEAVVQLVETRDRAAVNEMLTLTGLIDVIIPRGGASLTKLVAEESRVPTLLHLEGNCHTYIHERAEAGMAEEVLVNAKLRRVGVCGATESLIIDASIATELLPRLASALIKKSCTLKGDEAARAIDARIEPATEEDWRTEYLAPILSVKVVAGLEEAIAHINTYGSHHTDAIITDDKAAARQFLRAVDSAIVLHNASTQFADGGEFGFGAEIGIATGRLHARGPVGAEQLTTYKYVVHGQGTIRP